MGVITLYRSEIIKALADVECYLTWEQLSPANRKRLAILILRLRIDRTSHAYADLLQQGSASHDAWHVVEDLTATR